MSVFRWIANFFCPPKDAGVDLQRRHVTAAAVMGLGGGWLFHAQPSDRNGTWRPLHPRKFAMTPAHRFQRT